ncbi:unnamed protein product [Tetraodon nigroviridis]|uniref:Chromosome 15 SCAF14556, whole genome shotgun sequence n=1 Tax=Tetraodon nigroviridis TaxID=99883 RepID=Q4SLM7_TETNG|nr:unnamed protein product [Tetraodon nigroviridis]
MSVDVVLSRGRAAYVSAAGWRPAPQSQDAALTSVSCKKAISLQDSPLKPGNTLSLSVRFCHRGRSTASSPDGGEQGGEAEIRKRMMTDSALHIRPAVRFIRHPPAEATQTGCCSLYLCFSEVIRCSLVT